MDKQDLVGFFSMMFCGILKVFVRKPDIEELRYYEIIKGIEINEIIADTILIYQVFWRMKN
jgi:hypothetical protein